MSEAELARNLAMGRAARLRGDHAAALAHFRSAIAVSPQDAWAQVELGRALSDLGQAEEAEAELTKLLARAAPQRVAILVLGRLARRHGEQAVALARFQAWLSLIPNDVEFALNASHCLVDLGRQEEAAALLEGLLAEAPDNVHLRHRLGQLARQRGDRKLALRHFEVAMAADPGHLWAALDTAQELLGQNRAAEAEGLLRRLLDQRPDEVEVKLRLAQLARRTGRVETALDQLRAVLEASPQHVQAGLDASQCLADLGRPEAAAALLEGLVAQAPDNVHLRHRLGQLARQRGDRKLALGHFEAAMAADPGHLWAALNTAQELAEAARLDDAEAILRVQLDRSPGQVEVLLRLGQLARRRGERETALAHFQAAMRSDPDNPWAIHEASQMLAEQGLLDAAQQMLRRQLERHPGNPQMLLWLGNLARRQGDRTAALELYRASLEADPLQVSAGIEVAQELIEFDQMEEAEAVLREQLGRHPGHVTVLQRLAQLARRRGARDEALAHMLAVVAVAPGDPAALSGLAGEYRQQGRFSEAHVVAMRLLELEPGSPQGHVALGMIARWQGERAAALGAFRAAHALQPGHPQHLVDIAAEEQALGRPDAAQTVLRQALALEPHHIQATLQLGELQMAGEGYEDCLKTCHAALAVYPTVSWLHHLEVRALLALKGAQAALAKLEEAIRLTGERPELLSLRFEILRQTGQDALLREMLPAAEAPAQGNAQLWQQAIRYRISTGGLAQARAALGARIPAHLQESGLIEGLRGHLADTEWRITDAIGHYREALRLNPNSAHMAYELSRALMLDCEVEEAAATLTRFMTLEAGGRRLRGESLNPSQTHIGQLLDEFLLEREVLAKLRGLRALPAAERIGPLRTLVLQYPDHTPVAMALMLALRQAGGLTLPAPSGGARVPRRIAQYWMQAEVPEDLLPLMQSWREQNPGHEWRLFDHAAACDFLRAKAPPPVLRAYLGAQMPAQRADLFRLAWLHAEGGVYADADDRCHAPLGTLLPEGVELAAYQEDYATLGNNLLACVPGHPVIGRALALATGALNRGDTDLLWLSTGPGLLTRAFAVQLAEAPESVADWLARIAVLERWQLAGAVAVHCRVKYKQTNQHWSRSVFVRRKVNAGSLIVNRNPLTI